jgi:hypothetical protein
VVPYDGKNVGSGSGDGHGNIATYGGGRSVATVWW